MRFRSIFIGLACIVGSVTAFAQSGTTQPTKGWMSGRGRTINILEEESTK